MTNDASYSVQCVERGPHEASLQYMGAVCRAGALDIEAQLEQQFGYMKYERVWLGIESPGGEIAGLEYVLRVMNRWKGEGRKLAIQTKFQCASAAAFLLAMGEWGQRKVDPATFLLFHSARVDGAALQSMTAVHSTHLTQTLLSVDRSLLSALMNHLLAEAGGEQALASQFAKRAHYIDQNWPELALGLSTLTNPLSPSVKPKWLKPLLKLSRMAGEPTKVMAAFRKYLDERLQLDVRMDLCEAYVLSLIDQIDGVISDDTADSCDEVERYQALVYDRKLDTLTLQ